MIRSLSIIPKEKGKAPVAFVSLDRSFVLEANLFNNSNYNGWISE